jgi:hypothetical protein
MFCLSSGADSLLAGVRRLCLALPEVTVGLTHGGETWFDELVAEDPRRFFVPRFGGYDWVECGWICSPTDPAGKRSPRSSRMPIARLRRSSSSPAGLNEGDLRSRKRLGALIARQHGVKPLAAARVRQEHGRPLGRPEPALRPLQRRHEHTE